MERLYVYIDESGTLDKAHNKYFVYAGILALGKNAKNEAARQQLALEDIVKKEQTIPAGNELKANRLDLKTAKRFIKLSTEKVVRFAVVVYQDCLHEYIFNTKQDKQRYLDYALKIAIKRALLNCFKCGIYKKDDIAAMDVIVDEHSSSTNGKYNLVQTINAEFRTGVWNPQWNHGYPPVFTPSFPEIKVSYVDSASVPQIRIADITANWVYRAYRDFNEDASTWDELEQIVKGIYIHHLP